MLVLTYILTIVLIPVDASGNLPASFLVAVASYGIYWMVIFLSGFAHRALPALTAIIACGSLLAILYTLVYAGLSLVAGKEVTETVAWLIIVWSIPVEGHILARTIEQHWFIGIGIALSIFVMQNIAYVYIVQRASA